MTTLRFSDYQAVTSEIAHRIIDTLKAEGFAAEFGASNVSCSTYVEVEGIAKVRLSDHRDVHGSDITLPINGLVRTVYTVFDGSEDGREVTDLDELTSEERETADYIATEIDAADIDRMVAEAVAFVRSRKG